jgi:hypothetical protein
VPEQVSVKLNKVIDSLVYNKEGLCFIKNLSKLVGWLVKIKESN